MTSSSSAKVETREIREIELSASEIVGRLLSLDPARRLSLLDSGKPSTSGGRLLIAGFDPVETIEICDRSAVVQKRGGEKTVETGADALDLLDRRLAEYAKERKLSKDASWSYPFGACIATFSYDLSRRLERLRTRRRRTNEELTEPDAVFAFYDGLVLHDYETQKSFIASTLGSSRVVELENVLANAKAGAVAVPAIDSEVSSNMTRAEYIAAVERIKSHIADGDIYQANLTQQLSCCLPRGLDVSQVFTRLRRDHPAPFSAFIQRDRDTVVSVSPERFLSVGVAVTGERIVEAWPIKGTIPRGANAASDQEQRSLLQRSAKDRAENVMIVDLMRNDLGRVCRYGSVEVVDLCAIQELPSLYHLVSRVRGTLREDVTAGDLLRATFPCGSITGAPKIRAMEIIDDLEPACRGLSMGAIGYFSFDGSLDLNVAIRTMTIDQDTARFNVGGGVVADSDPEKEYEESLLKARALLHALGAM